MQEWQERVIAEKAELVSRLAALDEFYKTDAFKALGHADQELMWRQGIVMADYSSILAARIARFK